MAKVGRPSIYNEKLVGEIMRRLRMGDSVRKICRDPDMPDMSTFYDWLDSKPEFSKQYADARKIGYERMIDEVLDIADTVTKDDPRDARLMVDTRKWALSKVLPKIYGDRVAVDNTHSGEIQHNHNIDVKSLSKEQRDALKALAQTMDKK